MTTTTHTNAESSVLTTAEDRRIPIMVNGASHQSTSRDNIMNEDDPLSQISSSVASGNGKNSIFSETELSPEHILTGVTIKDPANVSLLRKDRRLSSLIHNKLINNTENPSPDAQEIKVECANGFTLTVTVQGDRNKPAIFTYHDIGLNHTSQFQNFFDYDDMALISKRFCIYHIDAPGQEENALSLDESMGTDSPNATGTSYPTNGSNGVDEDKIGFTTNLPKTTPIAQPNKTGLGIKSSFTSSASATKSALKAPALSFDSSNSGQQITKSQRKNSLKARDSAQTSASASALGAGPGGSVSGFFSSIWQSLNSNINYPTMDGLAEMLTDVVKHFELKSFIGFGVGAGANILCRYALRHPDRVEALYLIDANGMAAGWTEWGYQKLNSFYLRRNSNSLTHFTHEYLIWHHFGKITPDKNSDLINAFRDYFQHHINNQNLAAFIESYIKRTDLGITRKISLETLEAAPGSAASTGKKSNKNFTMPIMIVVGSESPHVEESEALFANIEPNESSWLKVSNCGGMVLEERPDKVAEAFRLFLQGLGYIPYMTHSSMSQNRRADFQKYRSLSTNAYSNLYPLTVFKENAASTHDGLKTSLPLRSYSMAVPAQSNLRHLNHDFMGDDSGDNLNQKSFNHDTDVFANTTNNNISTTSKKILKVIDIPTESINNFISGNAINNINNDTDTNPLITNPRATSPHKPRAPPPDVVA